MQQTFCRPKAWQGAVHTSGFLCTATCAIRILLPRSYGKADAPFAGGYSFSPKPALASLFSYLALRLRCLVLAPKRKALLA